MRDNALPWTRLYDLFSWPVGTFRELHNIFSFAFLYTKTWYWAVWIPRSNPVMTAVLSYNHNRIFLTVVTHPWAFGDSSCILEVRPFPYFCFCVPCEGISFTINRLQSGIKHRLGTLHALIVVVHCTITAIETKLHNRIYKVCPRNNQ